MPSARLHLTLLLACITGCSSLSASRVASDEYVPGLLEFTDPIAHTAEIGLLREAVPSKYETEVRIWVGFGVVVPNEMVRILASSDGVSGQIYVHYPADLSYVDEAEASEFRDEAFGSCTRILESATHVVCVAQLKPSPRWDTLLRNLVRLGLFTLPDQSRLPPPKWQVLDGVAMLVELRSKSHYRAYEYSNPSFNEESAARNAEKIMRTIRSFIDAATS